MTNTKAVMQQALDALKAAIDYTNSEDFSNSATRECVAAISELRYAMAQPEQPENSGELHFPLMCKAFRTTVSQGLDKRYEMVFAFSDLTALHAADTEWLNFREAAIAQPTQARMLRNLVATMLTKKPIEQSEPVSQPLTHKEIQEIWEIWESQVFPIIDMETVHPPIAQPEQTAEPEFFRGNWPMPDASIAQPKTVNARLLKALRAAVKCLDSSFNADVRLVSRDSYAAIAAAELAQPEQTTAEPVAWVNSSNLISFQIDRECYPGGGNLAQPAIRVTQVQLTPEQRESLRCKTDVSIPGIAQPEQKATPVTLMQALNFFSELERMNLWKQFNYSDSTIATITRAVLDKQSIAQPKDKP